MFILHPCPAQALANGDTTGFSGHADFQNGWAPGFLQKFIDTCDGAGGSIENCPAFNGIISEQRQSACRLHTNTQIPQETIGRYGVQATSLPGDNLLWSSTRPKASTPNPPKTPSWGPSRSAIDSSYTLVGCIKEGLTGRALTGTSFVDSAMTLSKCVSFCKAKGFNVAGAEYCECCVLCRCVVDPDSYTYAPLVHECFCGNSFSNGATAVKADDTECNAACDGNSQCSVLTPEHNNY